MKVAKDTVKPLSDVDVRKMLKAPNMKIYAGFRDFTSMILILDCGIRVGELLDLTINDVDLKLGLINIRAIVSKTRVDRTVPISKKTCKLLGELIKSIEDSKCDFIFQSSYGGKLDKLQITKNYEKYGKRVGLKVKCTPYVFRHTFATNFVKQGGDVFTLQRIMGHTNISTTRQYVQLDKDDLIIKHRQVVSIDKYI